MKNSFKILMLGSGLALACGVLASVPSKPASAENIVLAQNDSGKKGFWGLFGWGGDDSSSGNSNSRPVYVDNNASGASAGRSIYGGAGSARQAKEYRARAASYELPPPSTMGPAEAAEARLLRAQEKAAEAFMERQAKRERDAALAAQQQNGYQSPSSPGYGQPVPGEGGKRVIYKKNSGTESVKKPIRLFDVR